MVQADELATLLGISDSAPDGYQLIPGNAELEANTTKAVRPTIAITERVAFVGTRANVKFTFFSSCSLLGSTRQGLRGRRD